MPVWKLAGAGEAAADPLQRDAHGRLARRRRPAGRGVGRRGLRDGQAEARRGRGRRSHGRGGPGGGRARREDPRRRERGVGRAARHGPAEPDRAVRDRARRAAGQRPARDGAGRGARPRCRWPPTRRSRPRRTPTAPSSGGRAATRPRSSRRSAAPGAARQIARVIPTYLSSALDGPVGIAAAAHAAQILRDGRHRPGHRPRPGHPAPLRRDDRHRASASFATASLHLPDGPGLGVELDEDALARPARSVSGV